MQPSLVLLQKTLLNIEGLGRQLYPDLDLWATAHPFLERWLLNHFGPSGLFRRLRRDGPEWIEQLPELPQLAIRSLEQLKKLEETLSSNRPVINPDNTSPGMTLKITGALLTGAGLGSLLMSSQSSGADTNTMGVILAAAGALLLLLR